MKRFNIIVALIIVFLISNKVISQIDTAWISKGLFPDANISSATVVKADPAGNIFVAGTIYNDDLPYENIFVAKYNEIGEIIWLQTYGSEDTLSNTPNTLCIDSEGNPYITFMKHNAGLSYWSIAVQKYSATEGTLLWTSELADAQFNAFEWQVKPKYMTIDDNNLYIAGTKFESGTSGSEMLGMKLNFDGDILWAVTHKGSGMNANAKSIAVDEMGNVYVVGDAWNISIDYFLVKLNPDGDLIWDVFLDGDVYQSTDIAECVLVDDNGNVYMTGYNQISSNLTDIVTAKYDQNGEFQWKQSYGNPEYRNNNGYYLGMDENGDLYVGGYSAYEDPYPGTGKDYILLKYDPAGNLLWDARFDHFNYINDHPFDFDMGPDGNVYICGISVKSCYPNIFITVIKYNQQGELVWNCCVPNLYGTPWGIDVIGNDEFVVAAGSIDSNMVSQATTIKYISGPPSVYETDILNVFFESQIEPPIIDYENHTVTAFVHDTSDLQYLVPHIAISDYACMYPDDEDTTSFIVPVWYNVTSFDNVEQWWIVQLEGGYVGNQENNEVDFLIYPNPVENKFIVLNSGFCVETCNIKLFDLYGKCVAPLFQGKLTSDRLEFNVRHLPDGVYLLRILIGEKSITKRIILLD